MHLFQGRFLPAADGNGTLDPYVMRSHTSYVWPALTEHEVCLPSLWCRYVVVKVCGQKKKSGLKKKTTYPVWYETLSFQVDLPPLRFASQVRGGGVRRLDVRAPCSSYTALYADQRQRVGPRHVQWRRFRV